MKNLISLIDWKKMNGLVPTIIQDSESGALLMLGYMNRAALRKTLQTRRIWFYSRSRERLWMKGETSGNILRFVDAVLDCDHDALLVWALPEGPTCHTGGQTCFGKNQRRGVFEALYRIIESRKKNPPQGSYTASLFSAGIPKICEKITEEATEVVFAAEKESQQRLVEESVDLLYHLFVLLVKKRIGFSKLIREIVKRFPVGFFDQKTKPLL